VQVTNNIVRHVASGVAIQGLGANTSIVTNDVVFVEQHLFRPQRRELGRLGLDAHVA
jgi:hypothetical protein